MTTKEKIEQLIEKWKLKQEDLHNVGCPIDGYYIYVAEIIKDLQSLQDTTEERECEIIDEMKKLKSSLDKLKSMGLSVTYNTYYSLIEKLRENNIILA